MATSAEVIASNADNMIADARGAIQRAIVYNKLARVVPYLMGPLSGPMLVAQYFSNEDSNQKNLIKTLKSTSDEIELWATRNRTWAVNGKRDNGSEYNWDKWGNTGEAWLKAAYDLGGMTWSTSPTALMLAQAREFVVDPTKPTIDVAKLAAKKVTDAVDSWWERNSQNVFMYGGIGLAALLTLGGAALYLSRPKIVVQTGLKGLDAHGAPCRCPRRKSHRRR